MINCRSSGLFRQGRALAAHPWSRGALSATLAALAIVLPLLAWRTYSTRLARLQSRASDQLRTDVAIDGVFATTTASVVVRGLRVGGVLSVPMIEAGVSFESLMRGQTQIDDVDVVNPTINVWADPNGSSNLHRLVSRVLVRRHRDATIHPRKRTLPRVDVTGGDLVVHLADTGVLRVSGVKLTPQRGRFRVTTGPATVTFETLPWTELRLQAHMRRAAFEITIQDDISLGRAAADGGYATVSSSRGSVKLDDLVVSKSSDAPWDFFAQMGRGQIRALLAANKLAVTAQSFPLTWLELLDVPIRVGQRASATGRVELGRSPVNFSFQLALDQLQLEHARLATSPVQLSASVRGGGTVVSEGSIQRWDLKQFHIATKAIAAQGAANLSLGSGRIDEFSVGLDMAPTPCDAALASLPESVTRPLSGLGLTGTLAGGIRVHGSSTGVHVGLNFPIRSCSVFAEPAITDLRQLRRGGDHLLPDGRLRLLSRDDGSFAELAAIPRHTRDAFTSAEDGTFYRHRGFDLQQMERSLALDISQGNLVRGGSTITQQTAKNLFLHHGRTAARKIQEAIFAWRLEQNLSKQRILEIYLNIIELSDASHFGITEAAHYWFGRRPRNLTVKQSAFLAALTAEPKSMSRRIRSHGGIDPATKERIAVVLRAMYRDRHLTQDQMQAALVAPLHFAEHPLQLAEQNRSL